MTFARTDSFVRWCARRREGRPARAFLARALSGKAHQFEGVQLDSVELQLAFTMVPTQVAPPPDG